MARPYSTESIASHLHALGLPFAKHFSRALVALLTAKKISLHQIVKLMPGKPNAEANRMQLRRCLDHENLDRDTWAKIIAALLTKGKWLLALDRTEWKRGKTTVNLLVLSVVIHGCAVPLLWTVMPDCGASDTAERIELIERFLKLFGPSRWLFLTADREFIGDEWIGFLLENKLDFRIRIKAKEYLGHPDGRDLPAREWFGKRSCRCKPHRLRLWNQEVYVGGKYLYNEEYLVVIGNSYGNLLADYRLRWKIETLFQALKGRGFDLESCRIHQETRLHGWFGFLALGFCWCLVKGAVLEEAQPLKPKKHGRKSVSTFRRGLDFLSSLVSCLSGCPCQHRFEAALDLLDPTGLASRESSDYRESLRKTTAF
jgi:Transposase DDE domain